MQYVCSTRVLFLYLIGGYKTVQSASSECSVSVSSQLDDEDDNRQFHEALRETLARVSRYHFCHYLGIKMWFTLGNTTKTYITAY